MGASLSGDTRPARICIEHSDETYIIAVLMRMGHASRTHACARSYTTGPLELMSGRVVIWLLIVELETFSL